MSIHPPSQVKIGARIYTIQYSHKAMDEYAKGAGEDGLGLCQHRICNMIVDDGYPLSSEMLTVVHETLHAIIRTYNLGNVKPETEQFIALMALALQGVLRDNPKLVAYLTQEATA